MAAPIFHLALLRDWKRALDIGRYDGSTLGRSFAEEGFVHTSFAHQVEATADRYYRDCDDVVLLTIDVQRLPAPPVIEDLTGSGEAYPHLYEPLPVDAVVEVTRLERDGDDRLLVDRALRGG